MSLLVKDVMVKSIVTIEAWATVRKAAELMNSHDIGCLIVVNERNPVGILTERDMLKRVLLQVGDPRKTRVGNVMSKPLITCRPETNIRDAIRLMNQFRIKKLPVVQDNRLLGLISITDIVSSLGYFEHIISSLCARCQYRKQQFNEIATE